MSADLTGRHRAVLDAYRLFRYGHLPPHLREHSRRFGELADVLVTTLPDDPMLTRALIKLWEAKNCAVFLAASGPADGGNDDDLAN
jgi:hypothetical protein